MRRVLGAVAILGLSGVLAAASVWLWRGSSGHSAPVEAAAPAGAGVTVAFASTASPSAPQPSPAAADVAPTPPAVDVPDIQSTASGAPRPAVPFPTELREAAVEATASTPAIAAQASRSAPGSAAPKQPSRVAVASAEATLPPASPFVPAPERLPAAANPPGGVPAAAAPPKGPSISAEEAQRLAARATSLLREGDIAGARLLLARAASSGEARGAFMLAETYDPEVLAKWNVRGIKPDPEKAKALYRQAAEGGLVEARGRMEALR